MLQTCQQTCQACGPEPAKPEHCQLGSMSLQDQVANKVLLTKGALEASIDHIRGAVIIAFPQGLPEWDLVRQALEGTEELAGTSVSIPPLSSAALYNTWLLAKLTLEE